MENEMDSVSAVISALLQDGYLEDFSFSSGQAVTAANLLQRFPEKFRIEKTYRFEDDTDPENEAVIYAVASADLGVKGFIVNGYSIYSNPEIDRLISKLNFA